MPSCTSHFAIEVHLENAVSILKKTIILQFILNIKQDHHHRSQSDRKSCNINNAVDLIPPDVAQGDLKIIFQHGCMVYSVFKLFTGFAIAAFIAWKLTVMSAMKITRIAAMANIGQFNEIRYG